MNYPLLAFVLLTTLALSSSSLLNTSVFAEGDFEVENEDGLLNTARNDCEQKQKEFEESNRNTQAHNCEILSNNLIDNNGFRNTISDGDEGIVDCTFYARDFEITNLGLENGDPFLEVEGVAGRSIPCDENTIYAYVFVTHDSAGNENIYAVASHQIEDSTEVGNDLIYHAHRIELTDGCITSLEEEGEANVSGERVTVEGTDVVHVALVQTVQLSIEGDNVCVEEVFDQLENIP